MGKLPTKDLKRLLDCIKNDAKIIVRPQLGFDAGVQQINGEKYLVVSTNPCISVPEEWFGWFLINYVASDIAIFGVKMEFCTINLLGAPTTEASIFQKIMEQTCHAADDPGISIVTGHTGTYSGLSTVIGVCTGYGRVDKDKLITPADVQPGDHVVCIKPLGLETVVNFALTYRALAEKLFGLKRTKELIKLVTLQSCVKEALQLAEIEGVHAMHDATEGGLTAALNEIAEASDVGFNVRWENLLIPEEVHKLKEVYSLSDVQVLSMSSAGTFLAAVGPEAREKVESILSQNGVEVRFLGYFTKDSSRVLVKNGEETAFPREADDPYARFFSAKR